MKSRKALKIVSEAFWQQLIETTTHASETRVNNLKDLQVYKSEATQKFEAKPEQYGVTPLGA